MKKYSFSRRNLYIILATIFYIAMLFLIIKNYPTFYFIPVAIIASFFIYYARKMNKQLKDKD